MVRLRLVSLVILAFLATACAVAPPVQPAVQSARVAVPPPLSAPSFSPLTTPPLAVPCPAIGVSAQPSGDDLAAAAGAGYRTVVNFRTPGEAGFEDEQAAVEALGMRYVAIPVSGYAASMDHADALAPVLAEAAAGPVLMHCKSGTRAKLVWTLWLARQGGLAPDAALEQGRRAGLSGDALTSAERVLAGDGPAR